jgi:hypothetical protein
MPDSQIVMAGLALAVLFVVLIGVAAVLMTGDC